MADKSLEEYDCDECLRRGLNKHRNCEGDQEKPRKIPILPAVPWMKLERCPKAVIDDLALALWDDFQDFSFTGHLPYDGGTYNQPAIWIETIRYCKSLVDKIQGDKRYMDYRVKKNRQDLKNDNTDHDIRGKDRKKNARKRMKRRK